MPLARVFGQDGDKSEVCLSPAGRPSEKNVGIRITSQSPTTQWVFRRLMCADVFISLGFQPPLKHIKTMGGLKKTAIAGS